MADSGSDNHSCEEALRNLQDLSKDLEQMLENMEKLSVKATWMAYEMVTTRNNSVLTEQMSKLNEAYQMCLDEVNKNWKAMIDEAKPSSESGC